MWIVLSLMAIGLLVDFFRGSLHWVHKPAVLIEGERLPLRYALQIGLIAFLFAAAVAAANPQLTSWLFCAAPLALISFSLAFFVLKRRQGAAKKLMDSGWFDK